MAEKQFDGIHTGHAPRFESWFWYFQLASWGLLLCLVVAGLAGAFGKGVLSQSKVQTARGDHVEFERLVRFKTPGAYRLLVVPSLGPGGKAAELRLHISGALLSNLKFRIAETTPMPKAVEPSASGVVLVYAPDSTLQAFPIELAFEPRAIGPVQGEIGISGTSPLSIRQFVLP